MLGLGLVTVPSHWIGVLARGLELSVRLKFGFRFRVRFKVGVRVRFSARDSLATLERGIRAGVRVRCWV